MAAFQRTKIKSFLVPGKHVHLVGIGGVSMRPLGLVLKDMGLLVTGSDMNASVSTEELISKGIRVSIGHRAENIQGADCIIRTAAAHNDNPEIAAARAAGIPVFERAQAWGVLMQAYRNAICISGTHGKTTTTSMVTQILMAAQMDPTVMIGGVLPSLHAGHRVGRGDTIVLESCEYCDSFLNFFPTLAVILNIDVDHLDYFKDLAHIQRSFRKFAQLVPKENGRVLANGDDKNTTDALDGLAYITFGLNAHNRVHGEDYSDDWRDFTVVCDGKPYCSWRFTGGTTPPTPLRRRRWHGLLEFPVRQCLRAWPSSGGRAGDWSIRETATARISMTTMPTTPASWQPPLRR